jgi:Lon protease-like protein
MKLPLLPLNAIVCPQGRIPLQIFEPHYLDMIAESMKKGEGFVSVLMRNENASTEHVQAGQFYELGTLVKIVDFGKTPSTGVLNLTVEGSAQVSLSALELSENGVWYADIHKSSEEQQIDLPEEFDELRVVLQALAKHPYVRDLNMAIDYEDGRQVGWRLTELLPLGNKQKQSLYEMNNPIDRLEAISRQIADMVT